MKTAGIMLDIRVYRHLGVVGITLLLMSGCVVHEARVTIPPAPPVPKNHDAPGPLMLVVGSGRKAPAKTTPLIFRSPLPIDRQISAWQMDSTGTVLCRSELRVTTPLSWWQRFPCDIVSDILPTDYIAHSEATVECVPIAATSAAELAESARRDGYAHDH